MSQKKFELHDERLATTDEHGRRIYIHPEDVTGFWKTRRQYFYSFLIILYLVLPWIYIGGRQIILLNIPKREFYIFGYTFYGQDAPVLLFIFIGLGFSFALLTSIWGRAWCGWACPQTVFIDLIFRKIEILVEGKARARVTLDRSPLSLGKVVKRALKWFLFLLVSLHIVHSFIGYFVGTHQLLAMSIHSPFDNITIFLVMLTGTAIILLDFGWFREQFCIIACPYGRMQSVAMDSDSLVVAYDSKRGEPRRGKCSPESEGDCINCYQCVKVCPTGIDIRRGIQLECIACTMCIDACDNIMAKLDKPRGLIGYASENERPGKWTPKWGPRHILYLIGTLASLGGLIWSLSDRGELEISLLRGSKSPYQSLKMLDGTESIVNHYDISFQNRREKEYTLWYELKDPVLKDQISITTPFVPYAMKKGIKRVSIFFRFQKNILKRGSRKIKVQFFDGKSKNTAKLIKTREINLVGPL